MRLLLDTHFLVWLATDSDRIKTRERSLLTAADSELFLSAVSFWEIKIKWDLLHPSGERKGSISPEGALRFAQDNHLDLIPLQPDDTTLVLDPPLTHRDPFDEMLLIQAKQLGALLLTRDGRLRGHPLALQL